MNIHNINAKRAYIRPTIIYCQVELDTCMSAMSEISESILDIPVVDDVIFDAKEFHEDSESFVSIH